MAKGKTLKQAKKLKKDDIIKKLKGMPAAKIHCSVLGIDALRLAIKNYEEKMNLLNKHFKKVSKPEFFLEKRFPNQRTQDE